MTEGERHGAGSKAVKSGPGPGALAPRYGSPCQGLFRAKGGQPDHILKLRIVQLWA